MHFLDYTKISNCLRKYRKTRGLKQKDVAGILGLKSTSLISRWERGVCLPSLINLLRLSILYRTLVDGLFIDLKRLLQKELLIIENKILKK